MIVTSKAAVYTSMAHCSDFKRYNDRMAQRSRKTSQPPVPNPTAVTEDEADYIVSERRRRENNRLIPFEEYLKEHGRSVVHTTGTSGKKRAR